MATYKNNKIDYYDPIYADIINGTAGAKLLNAITGNSNNNAYVEQTRQSLLNNAGTTSGLQAYSQATGTIGAAEKINPTDPAYSSVPMPLKDNETYNSKYKVNSATSSNKSNTSANKTSSSNASAGIINYGFKPAYSQSQAVTNAANQLAKAEAASPGSYQQSQAVINAANQLAQIEANRPGSYQQSQAVIDALNTLSKVEASKPGAYQQSQAVIDALNTLEQFEANRPGEYQSNYAGQIQGLLDQIINREAFTYDFSADPMYQMYADQYQQKGQMAMMDTMGQAAALTGGYGSTYAQNVGQQAYNAYLQELNNIIPELRDAAYQMYRDEGTDMYNQIGLLQGLEESDYSRYRDAISDYLTDRDYLYGKYYDISNIDYSRYRDTVNDFYTDRDYYYGKYSDISDDDYNRYRDTVSDYFTDRGYYYGKYLDFSNMDYDRYRDAVNDFYTNRDYYYNKYYDTSAVDYSRYRDTVSDYYTDRDFSYQQSQDALAQSNYERELAYQMEKDALAQANYEKEMEYQQIQDELARYAEQDAQAYERYQDALAQYNLERDFASEQYWKLQDQTSALQDFYLALAKAEEDGVDISGIRTGLAGNLAAGTRREALDSYLADSVPSYTPYQSSTVSGDPAITNRVITDANGSETAIYVEGLGEISVDQLLIGLTNGTIEQQTNSDGSVTYVRAR